MSSLNFQELRDGCRKLTEEFEQNLLLVPPSLRDTVISFVRNHGNPLAYSDKGDLKSSALGWDFKVRTPIYSNYDVRKRFDWEYWVDELSYVLGLSFNVTGLGPHPTGVTGCRTEFFPLCLQVIYEYPVLGSRCKEVEHLTDIFPHASANLHVDMGESFFFKMVIRDFSELNLKLYKLMSEADPNIFYCWDEARKRAGCIRNLSRCKEVVHEVGMVLPVVIRKLADSKSFAKSKILAEARQELEQLQGKITETLTK